MKKILFCISTILLTISLIAGERECLWSKKNMPHAQGHQIAAMTSEVQSPGFKADKNRISYIEWFDAPAAEVSNGGCMILISGGAYNSCCDVDLVELWKNRFTELGFQCVNFVYRTPRPEGLPIYQSAWADGQRAVRKVRSEAQKRGFDPEKIGVISMSAGSHLALLLATSSQTPAYARVDELDDIPCHINWAIANAPAYGTTDADSGTPSMRQGYGPDVRLSDVFKFDEKTCPISFHHGGLDIYSPYTSTLAYRQLRRMNIPAELHLYPDEGHAALGLDRAVEFMRQMGFVGPLKDRVSLEDRYSEDSHRGVHLTENVWPEGKTPDFQEHQCVPYIEWHIPKELRSKSIQIIYSGGSYEFNSPESFEVAPIRRYLNEKGVAVVTLKYRTPRPEGLAKHTTAWQDLQRTVRIVRSKAKEFGLDPDKIGIMGSSAGGHLTLMGVTSSRHQSYGMVDDLDRLPCNVQWGIGIYPAYALTDGVSSENRNGGNEDTDVLVPEFSFDLDTAPMLFIHGDADGYAAMNSVKVWEKMQQMGIQSELHTLALQYHCFHREAHPETGSYTFIDRIWEFLQKKGFVK